MGEIKFMAWIKHYKIMTEVKRINFDCKTIEVALGEGDLFEFSFGEINLLQHTGSKNKEGKKIYKGDIYKVLDRDWYDYEKDAAICEVVFDEGNYKFKRIKGGRQYRKNLHCSYGRDRMEYLGNKYENPELLESD